MVSTKQPDAVTIRVTEEGRQHQHSHTSSSLLGLCSCRWEMRWGAAYGGTPCTSNQLFVPFV